MSEISDNEDSSSSDEELEIVSKIEKPKRVYNRKPLTDEAKEAFKERMKKARESKKNKAEGITPPVLEKVEKADPPKPKGRPKKIVIPKEEPIPKQSSPKQSSTKEATIVNNYYYDSKPKKETKSKKETKARVPRVKKEKAVSVEQPKPPKIPIMNFA